MNAIPVVLIVLRRIDASLRRDAMSAARAVLITEAFDLVAELRKRGSSRSTSQSTAHDKHGVLALVVRIDQPGVHLVLGPLLGHGP